MACCCAAMALYLVVLAVLGGGHVVAGGVAGGVDDGCVEQKLLAAHVRNGQVGSGAVKLIQVLRLDGDAVASKAQKGGEVELDEVVAGDEDGLGSGGAQMLTAQRMGGCGSQRGGVAAGAVGRTAGDRREAEAEADEAGEVKVGEPADGLGGAGRQPEDGAGAGGGLDAGASLWGQGRAGLEC